MAVVPPSRVRQDSDVSPVDVEHALHHKVVHPAQPPRWPVHLPAHVVDKAAECDLSPRMRPPDNHPRSVPPSPSVPDRLPRWGISDNLKHVTYGQAAPSMIFNHHVSLAHGDHPCMGSAAGAGDSALTSTRAHSRYVHLRGPGQQRADRHLPRPATFPTWTCTQASSMSPRSTATASETRSPLSANSVMA